MRCSKRFSCHQWLGAIIILHTAQGVFGAIPSFASPSNDGSSSKSIPETTPSGTSIYTLDASDSEDPTGASITYSLDSQTPSYSFTVSGSTVVTTGTFDYERGSRTFTLVFSVTTVNGSDTANLTVTISDVNDETPVITGSLTASIDEELSVGTVLPTMFTATDADENDVLKYSLSGDNSYFNIDIASGNISIAQILDFDTLPQHTFSLTVGVRDAAGHTASQPITIHLLNINDNEPVFSSPHPSGSSIKSIPETISAETSIYKVQADDADGDIVTYNLISQNPDAKFRLDGQTLKTTGALDYETGSRSYNLTFRATSQDNTTTAGLTINILDVNDETPTITGQFTASIDEGLPKGTIVPLSFIAEDQDANDVLKYSISGDDSYFEIDISSGEIKTTQVLDYETMTKTIFVLTLTVRDKAAHSATQTITITVQNVNDNSPVFIRPLSSGTSTKAIPETTQFGDIIYTLEAIDADGNDLTFYLITQDPNVPSNRFKLVGSTLQANDEFDFETEPTSYRLTFSASSANESVTAVLTVFITDVNDETPEITGSFVTNITEGVAIGTVVPTSYRVDDADDSDVLQYSLNGLDSGNFKIDSTTGMIRTNQILDYETATKTFVVTLTVTDSAGHASSQDITINLINSNDNAPRFSPIFYYATVIENTAENTEVVKLTVSDEDGDRVMLTIATGDNINDQKFKIFGNSIQTTSSPIDYEALTAQNYAYTLTVTASDEIQTSTATVYITVSGVNEYDPVWKNFTVTPPLAENALIGTTVVTISATDADEGPDGTLSYTIDSISTNPSGRAKDGLFHLDEISGVLTTQSNTFDRDIATGGTEYYDIVVRAADKGYPSRFVTITVRVTLTDVNDNEPKFPTLLTYVSNVITEKDVAGKVVRQLDASDSDEFSNITYYLSLSSSPPSYDTFFKIEDNKIKLRDQIDLDDPLNLDDTFNLIVIAKDGSSLELSGTTTIVVTVAAMNEFSPVFTIDSYTVEISESISIDTKVYTVQATDADKGIDGQVTFSIESGDPDNHFNIGPSTGVIKVARSLDYEFKTKYVMLVKATDGGTPPLSNTMTVTINLQDVNDNKPTCAETSVVVSILENIPTNTQIALISCQDDDTDTVSYSIRTGDTAIFAINSSTGSIMLKRAVDFDVGEVFFALVVNVNSGTDVLEVFVGITILPVNEYPPIFNNPVKEVLSEDTATGTKITALSATDDDANPHNIAKYVIASVSNSGGTFFGISQSTGHIRLVAKVDYETMSSPKEYVLTVHAIDGGTPIPKTGTGTLTISIQDVNDNTPTCVKTSYTLTLKEDEDINSVLIADFGCSDADTGTTLQYSLDQSPANDFRLNGTDTLQLVLGANLNYDLISSYVLSLSVTDGLHAIVIDIDIVITDVNNGPPTFPQAQYKAAVSETASTGTSVITIVADDPDAETSPFGKLVYTLIVNPGLKFNIDPDVGTITVAGALDAEKMSMYNLVIQAKEEGGSNSATAQCNVTIEDENDNAPTCSKYSFSVSLPESTTASMIIYTLDCKDKDITSVLQYSLASGDTTLFQMNQSSLRLLTNIDYDIIVTDTFEVKISVSDGKNTVQVTGVVTVIGVNEYAPVFNPATYQVAKSENIQVGLTVVTVSATDADRDETVMYSLLSATEMFKIEANSGDIILIAELDREDRDSFELLVQASDGTKSTNATVSITVTDINDNTPMFDPTSYSVTIPENTGVNEPVITVTAIDYDDPSGPGFYGQVHYSLVDTYSAFRVDPSSGQITTTVEINYETRTFYTLSVKAVDSNFGQEAKSSTAVVTVLVTGINEYAPQWAEFIPAGPTYTLPENANIGSQILTLSATDEDDGIHGVVLYSLGAITTSPANKTTSGLFHLDRVSGVLTTTSNAFDRDILTGGTEYYDIQVMATDQGGWSATAQTIRIMISDVNDNPPMFTETVYHVEISEQEGAGKEVKVLTASDADATAVLTFTLDTSSTPSSYDTYFVLDGNTLKVKATADLDPPTSASSTFNLIVLVKDGGNPELTGTTTVIVTIKSANEKTPTFVNLPYVVNNLSESTAVGQEVWTVSAEDNEYGLDGVVIYSVIGGDPNSKFSVHPSSGKVKIAQSLDYESKSRYVMTIQAKDRGTPSKASTTTLTINVQDESDNEPNCLETLIDKTVPETYTAGQQVAEVSCTDRDIIDNIVYSIKSGDTSLFRIDSATGAIILKRDLDYDTGDSFFVLTINVQGGVQAVEVSVSIIVTAINEHAPTFTDANIQIQKSENTALGTTLAIMEAHDDDKYPDDHGIVRYSVISVSNGGDGLFSISQTSGAVRLNGKLDYESLTDPKEYVLKVVAIDGGTPTAKTGTATLTVAIKDENDNAPVCSQQSYVVSVKENAGNPKFRYADSHGKNDVTVIGTQVIADFGCTDADSGTNLSYSLTQDPADHFKLENTPKTRLLVSVALNFDETEAYTLVLSVSDGLHSTNIDIDIIVKDVNSGGPVFEKLAYSGSVSEAASEGTSVVTVKANDPDAATSPYGQLIYKLIENSGNKFNINPDTGTIRVAGRLDAEQQHAYTLVVEASELGGTNTATVTCNVTVQDENDNKPECKKYSFSVSVKETVTPPFVMTALSCSDKDITAVLNYSISVGDTSLFGMKLNSLELISSIDYDTSLTDTFVVEIDVSDGTHVVQVSGIVKVTAENEQPPIFTEGTYRVSKPEDIAQGTTIIKLTATDADKGDKIEYSFSSPDTADFSIDKATGEVIILSQLDREDKENHELVVHAFDGLHTATATLIITVTDVNDHTPTFQSASYSVTVPENTNPDHTVITVSATDLDDPNTASKFGEVRYSIINTIDVFAIDGISGQITTTQILNYEDTQVYTLFVQATDSGGGTLAKSSTVAVTVKVGNVNEDTPAFTRNTYSVSVPENTEIGSSILQVTADDNDFGMDGKVIYSMATHSHFYLNSKTGTITLKASLDYESADRTFTFEVTASDSATPPKSSSCTVSISVTDVNDNEPICNPSMQVASVREDSLAGTFIAQFVCSDLDSDANANLVYTISSVNLLPSNGLFTVDTQGRLTLALSTLNFETVKSYSVLVTVRDSGKSQLTTTATVKLEVSDINEHLPVFEKVSYKYSIPENFVSDQPIISVHATDQDTSNRIRYFIEPVSPFFDIDDNSGDMYIVSELDYETIGVSKSIEVVVYAADDGTEPGPKTSSTTVTIDVSDANDGTPRFAKGVYYGNLSETSAAETTVLRVSASDSDGETLTFTMDDVSDTFRIEQSGDIVLNDISNLDYDNGTKLYNVIVHAKDPRGNNGTATVYISVRNVNEYPPVFTDFDRTVSVKENTENNNAVTVISATDLDDGVDGQVTFAIISGDDGKFSVDKYSGQIIVSGSLDREVKTSYTLTISAIDGGTPQKSTLDTLTINIIDVNDLTPHCDKQLYSIVIPEDTAFGSSLLTLICTDADNDPNGINNRIGSLFITDGNLGETFEVLPTGEVKLKGAVDREKMDSYTLTVTVADSGAPARTTTVTVAVQITDINDNDPVFDQDAYHFSFAEDSDIGYIIGSVHANDSDIGPAGLIHYQILTGNQAGKFAVDELSGQILLEDLVDFDTTDQSFILNIMAINNDASGRNSRTLVAIDIEDVNDNMPNCSKSLYTASVAENVPVTTTVVNIHCTDVDTVGLPLSYVILSGNDAGYFAIGESTGIILTTRPLDAESNDRVELTVNVKDGTFATTLSVVVDIIDINEHPPVFSPVNTLFVAEDTPVGSLLHILNATDADMSATQFRYSIIDGDSNNHFKVGATSGAILLQKSLDRELVDSYSLTVQVVDGLGGNTRSSEIDITFIIEDVNDNYPECEQSTYTVTVPENSPGRIIVTPVCSDKDSLASPQLKYRIISGNNGGIFSMNVNTGQIDLIGKLDYETAIKHELTCKVDDQGSPSNLTTSIVVIVHVSPVNEFLPQFIETLTFDTTIRENVPVGTTITQVKAIDDDKGLEHGVVRFFITNGNVNNHFAINSVTGEIILVKSLDYEAETEFSLTVTAKDSLGQIDALSSDFIIHIAINDTNDNAPECSPSLVSKSYNENYASGSSVARLQCTDDDISTAFNTLKYNIISINGNMATTGQFSLSNTGVLALVTVFDYEQDDVYNIVIKVSDDGPPVFSTTATVHLTIIDINEHKPTFEIPQYTANLKENTPIGSPILTVKAQDQDINDMIRYSFDPENSQFEIDPITGDIILASKVDYDSMGSDKNIILTVIAKDDGSNLGPKSSSVDIIITVLNENDGTPTFIPGVYTAVISENEKNGYTVTTVTATDIDDTDLRYNIIGGNVGSVFQIDKVGSNGAVVISDSSLLNYEQTKTYSLVVHAVDAGGLTGTTTVVVDVTGYNDFKPQLSSLSSEQSVPEDSSIGYSVIDLDAYDDDDGPDGDITYTIISGASGKFAINPTSGLVTVAGLLNREIKPFYTLEIAVADRGVNPGPSTVTYTLTVRIADVNDVSPVCTSSFYSVVIKEANTTGSSVARLNCSDMDAESPNNQITTYVITSGNEGGEFSISSSGQVTTNQILDYETKHYYELVFEVSDSGTPPLTTTTTLGVTVADENDNPPVFTKNPYRFEAPEDTTVGASVGVISATDLDASTTGEMVYSIVSGNDDGVFALDRRTGILYIAKALDYDTGTTEYSLVVRASDKSTSPLFDTSTIQFSIRDVNDNYPTCSDSLYRGLVREDAPFQTSVTTVSCNDVDTMNTLSYSIVGGNTNSVFIIDRNSGEISVAKANVIDAETLNTYDLIIQVSDGKFAINITVVVSVIDVNDKPPVFISSGPHQVDLSEDAPIGHTLINLTASDGDVTPTIFRFSIQSGNEDGKFKIGTLNGVLQLNREVDRDSLGKSIYTLSVTVSDGLFTATTMVHVNVMDVNDNSPICDQVTYTAVVPETSAVGSTVFEPNCNDPDLTTDLRFQIVSGNDESKFLIDEDDGKLKIQSPLDFETTTSYTLTVTVSDQGAPSLTTTLLMTVFVGPVNEHKPNLFGDFNVSIFENAVINQVVVDLHANDSDKGLNHATITFAIKNGNNKGLFYINPSTGIITLRGMLDYETANTHVLTIMASDMSPGDSNRKSAEEILIINVRDINDNYPVFDPQVYAAEVNEDALVGKTIVELTATDADSGLAGTNGLQFRIIQGNTGSVFSIAENAIILAGRLDAEAVANYILIVRASDQGNPVLSANTVVSIYVKAINEHSPAFSLTNDTVSVSETITVGDFVYLLTATDEDTGVFSELRYYIRGGNANDAFTLDMYSGKITVGKPLNYEVLPGPYILQLEVEDTHKTQPGITRTSTMTLTVKLIDINDETPVFTQNTYSIAIDENTSGGTKILTVTAVDKDTGPNGQITYQFVAGDGMSVFSINSVSGTITTKNGSVIDYETLTSYDLIVKAEDSGSPKQSSSCLVHITIIDLNDETPKFEVERFVTNVLEQEPINTYLTSVIAIDKDSIRNNNNVFSYSFSEVSASFAIDATTGEIHTTAILDREKVSSYTLVVYAVDQGPNPNTGSTTITVQVVDVNDNPPVIDGLPYDTTVSENAITNTAVFLIVASDKDIGENGLLTYAITDGNTDGDFKIDSGTGNIQVKNRLDRERTQFYHLEITVTDGGTPEGNAITTATVTITDINDNPPVFAQSIYHLNVSENVPVDTPVGRITATDADTGTNAALRYMIGSFVRGDSNHFKVDAASGVIRTSGLLDRETSDIYVFIYRAFDGGTNSLTATATVSITVGDFDDQIPEFEDFLYSAHTLENQPVGTSILTVVTSDTDFGQNAVITLSIDAKTTEGARANEFIAVDSTTSILSVKKPINRETDASFNFIIIATDGGESPLTATATVSIIVDDVNDERPAFSPTYYNAEISYNDDCAVTVTTLSATDKDYGVNAEFLYRFTLNPVPHLFRLEGKTGDITLLATANRNTKYILYAEAKDLGTPPLTSNGVTIRIDTFTPNDHVISFNLGIDETTYKANEQIFLQQLTTVYQLTYPTATVKRWCLESDVSENILTRVHLYVVKNNLTDTEASIEDVEKEFLTSSEAFAVVSVDDAGTPSNNIKGSAWEIFDIVSTEKYYVKEEDEPPFFQTGAGVAVLVLIVLLLVAGLVVGAIFALRKARKHNWPACLNQVEHGEDDAGDHVARNQYLTKTYEKKPLPPIPYYDKSNLPPPVVALSMPASTKKVPMQGQDHVYERPKDINFFNELIGFRPGSGVGSRLMKHPEKLRAGSPTSIPELPPVRKLASLVSRPPGFVPMKDVSLREETPRQLDESTRTIDDETVSFNTTKEFDGRAVDPVTGRVYEYSTRTHERRWVNDSENGSHFKLKTEEK